MTVKWNQVFGAFPPGDLIRDELKERGWTQRLLAEKMGRPLQIVGAIINGKKSITAETALQLQRAFGVSATMWLGLESDWQLRKVYDKQKAAKRAKKKAAAGPAMGLKNRPTSRPALPKSSGATKDKVVAKSVLKIRGASVK